MNAKEFELAGVSLAGVVGVIEDNSVPKKTPLLERLSAILEVGSQWARELSTNPAAVRARAGEDEPMMGGKTYFEKSNEMLVGLSTNGVLSEGTRIAHVDARETSFMVEKMICLVKGLDARQQERLLEVGFDHAMKSYLVNFHVKPEKKGDFESVLDRMEAGSLDKIYAASDLSSAQISSGLTSMRNFLSSVVLESAQALEKVKEFSPKEFEGVPSAEVLMHSVASGMTGVYRKEGVRVEELSQRTLFEEVSRAAVEVMPKSELCVWRSFEELPEEGAKKVISMDGIIEKSAFNTPLVAYFDKDITRESGVSLFELQQTHTRQKEAALGAASQVGVLQMKARAPEAPSSSPASGPKLF